MADVPKILEGLGLKAETLDKIRFSRGVVGKTSYVAVVLILTVGWITFKISNELYLMSVIFSLMLLFVLYFVTVLLFAGRHPDLALMEGAEITAYKQLEIALKGLPAVSPTPVISDPDRSALESPAPESDTPDHQ